MKTSNIIKPVVGFLRKTAKGNEQSENRVIVGTRITKKAKTSSSY